MANRYWPLFDLRIETSDLQLRPVTEADLPTLADLLPDDVEVDPRAITYPGHDLYLAWATTIHQGYWKSFANWRVPMHGVSDLPYRPRAS